MGQKLLVHLLQLNSYKQQYSENIQNPAIFRIIISLPRSQSLCVCLTTYELASRDQGWCQVSSSIIFHFNFRDRVFHKHRAHWRPPDPLASVRSTLGTQAPAARLCVYTALRDPFQFSFLQALYSDSFAVHHTFCSN